MASSGHVLLKTKISVDWWASDDTEHVDHYFCSHVTSENIPGLSPSWSKIIYCSEITGELLKQTCKIPDLLIVAIPFNEPRLVADSYTVTLYDANHSAGSAMFFFEGPFGRILYTGKFRWYESITAPFSQLQIDTVYFDNTYSRKSAKFITRLQCKEEAVTLCRTQLGLNKIIYFVLDPIGKEDIMNHIAETLGVKIVVSEDKYKLLVCMRMQHNFTTSKKDGVVFFVAKNKLNYKRSISQIAVDHFPNEVVFVKISGMRRGQNCLSYQYINFSDHSSMKEIEAFFADLKYASATPIVPRIDKEKSLDASPKTPKEETRGRKRVKKTEKLKAIKLRKVSHELSFGSSVSSVTVSPCKPASTPAYRVVTGQSTDEEAGNSPDCALLSPLLPTSCSTPNINDDNLQHLAVHLDYSTYDVYNPERSSAFASSPVKPPYIEPPICLDWLPSPIKSNQRTLPTPFHPILKFDEEIINVISSSDSDIAPSIEDDSSVEVLTEHLSPGTDQRHNTLSPYDVGLICNSPVYNTDGKITYLSPSIEMERHHESNVNGSFRLGSYQPNVSLLYEEMFKESEVSKAQSCSSNEFDDGIDVLNDTPSSVETLYVSDTESESCDEGESSGPLGDYLRGQYAINQIFNRSVVNIRESFANSVIGMHQRSSRKKCTEDDLAATRLELLLPKVLDSKHPPDTTTTTTTTTFSTKSASDGIFFDSSTGFVQSKEDYLRRITEIAERGRRISYKKPKKIGKSMPEARSTKGLVYDSIHLINNYTEACDKNLKDLTWKLNFDKTFTPKNFPVLAIKKKPLKPYSLKAMSAATVISAKLVAPVISAKPVAPVISAKLVAPVLSAKLVAPAISAKQLIAAECFVTSPSPFRPPCHGQSTPKPAKKRHSGLSTRQKPYQMKAPPKSAAVSSPDNIFDMLFGSTPTSAVKKRIKRLPKDVTKAKRLSASTSERKSFLS